MRKPKKEKDFLDFPKLSGGKNSFDEFIEQHLKYPEAALDKQIEGTVFIANLLSSVQKGVFRLCSRSAGSVD
ncbi:MAG: hypothetical protein R6U19_04025 [Bacteroidales bacterium]